MFLTRAMEAVTRAHEISQPECALRLPRSRGDTDRRRAIAEHRSTVGMAAYSVREKWKFKHHEAYFYVRYILDAVTTITPTGRSFVVDYVLFNSFGVFVALFLKFILSESCQFLHHASSFTHQKHSCCRVPGMQAKFQESVKPAAG